jgi:protein involved in polysaccharide export with SLBB domain
LLLGGCLAPGGDAPSAPAQADVLKPGDTLRITAAGDEELSGGFIVNSDAASGWRYWVRCRQMV